MPKRLPEETREEIIRLYDNDNGLTPVEIARQTGVSYSSVYGLTRVKERGFASRIEYREHLAKERQERPENQELSVLIKQRLVELEKTQKWLSQQLGITEGAVSRYLSGRTTPRRSLQEILFATLVLPYQTLDDLLE